MKKIVVLFLLMFSCVYLIAQETVKPSLDTEIVRKVHLLDIEGKHYNNVEVTMKSSSPDYFLTDHFKVKIRVKDAKGKTIYKKTLKNSYLYIYSTGQVDIGNKNFLQAVFYKQDNSRIFNGMIRIKEGIF